MGGRFLAVLALALCAWLGIGRWGPASSATLGLALLVGLLCVRGTARLRRLAPLVPALALLVHALGYAARPAPPRPLMALAVLACTGLALHLALWPLAPAARLARLGAGLALSGAILALALAGAEKLQRSRAPLRPYLIAPLEGSPQDSLYRADEELGLLLQPGFRGRFVHPEYGGEEVEINADGFRDRPWPAPDEASAGGILLLGDSTLFGLGSTQAQTIAARLEELLATRGAPRCFNAGVPGHGPRHALGLLRRLRARLRPSLVLYFFYDGNDLEDCRQQFVESRAAGLHQERLPSEEPGPGTGFRSPDLLAAPAALAPPLWTRAYWVRYSTFFRDLDRRLAPQLVRLGVMPIGVARNNGLLRAMQRQPDAGIQEELQLAEAAVRGMAEICGQAGAAFVLVRLPAHIQAEPSSLRGTLERLGQDPAAFVRERPGSVLLSRAAAGGIATLDLLPLLEAGEGELSPFYFREGHPNPAGNARIAHALRDFLGALGPSSGETPPR